MWRRFGRAISCCLHSLEVNPCNRLGVDLGISAFMDWRNFNIVLVSIRVSIINMGKQIALFILLFADGWGALIGTADNPPARGGTLTTYATTGMVIQA